MEEIAPQQHETANHLENQTTRNGSTTERKATVHSSLEVTNIPKQKRTKKKQINTSEYVTVNATNNINLDKDDDESEEIESEFVHPNPFQLLSPEKVFFSYFYEKHVLRL
jgi:hypothetical protein